MKERPSFEEINMRMAILVSERSTCKRLKVGCIITSTDFRKILSMGYNGNASGLPNTCDSDEPGSCGCLHSEMNAVINCDSPRSTEKIIFTTHAPCPMCFVGETPIYTPSPIRKAYKRWYEGSVLRVVTANSDFTVTPNHPILTLGRGWLPAKSLRNGDYLVNARRNEEIGPADPYHYDMEPIAQVFESLLSAVPSVRSSGSGYEFHGDGSANEDVDVVTPHRTLESSGEPSVLNLFEEPPFSVTYPSRVRLVCGGPSKASSSERRALQSSGPLTSLHRRDIKPLLNANTCLVQTKVDDIAIDSVLFSDELDRFTPFVTSSDVVNRKVYSSLSKVPSTALSLLAQDPRLPKTIRNSGIGHSVISAQRHSGLAGLVSFDDVRNIERNRWSGHVYNLETDGGWYCAGTSHTIVHNCAKFMVNLGNVQKVYYREEYRIRRGLDILEQGGIPFEQLKVT